MSKRKVQPTQVQEIPAANAAVQGVTDDALLDEIARILSHETVREQGEFTSAEMAVRWNCTTHAASEKLATMRNRGIVTSRWSRGNKSKYFWKLSDKAQQ